MTDDDEDDKMASKPLIALLTNNDDDVYCFRLELIQAILSSGYRLLISCPDGPKFDLLEEAGLRKNSEFIYDDPPIDRRGTSLRNDAKLILHYRRLFKRCKPGVVLAYTAKPNVYATLVASSLKIPVINNITGLGSVTEEKGIKKLFIMRLFKTAYRRSSFMMLQNSANLAVARENGWIKSGYRLIPGSGVALNRFPPQEYPDGGNGREGSSVVFNYIGRILHDKGIDDYLEAAGRVKAEYPNTEFNVIGFVEPTENHYCDELKKLEKEGIVHYRGSQKNVVPWIARSHCTIHPSIYGEGMSNVLLESAACGRPIITTDNPGCEETVDDCISGFIYHGGNVDELVEKIKTMLSDVPNARRRQMGMEGRKKVVREFDRQIVVDAYLETINSLLNQDIGKQKRTTDAARPQTGL